MTTTVKSSLALLGAALIWGLAFVAQRQAADTMGPFTFNGIRFLLGALSLLPFLWLQSARRRRSLRQHRPAAVWQPRHAWKQALVPGLACGFFLLGGVTFQQAGMIWAGAGEAAFLTSVYIVLVPLAGFLFRQPPGWRVLAGAAVALAGTWLLGSGGGSGLGLGEVLVLLSAVFWTGHILCLDRFAPVTDALHLSVAQYLLCGLASLAVGLVLEPFSWAAVQATLVPLLYAGIGSVGIAYTLQVVGQKGVRPGPAVLILCLETVFAALGGWIMLGERLEGLELLGCGLLLGGVVLSRLGPQAAARPEQAAGD